MGKPETRGILQNDMASVKRELPMGGSRHGGDGSVTEADSSLKDASSSGDCRRQSVFIVAPH